MRLVTRRPAAPPSSSLHSRIEVRPPELWPSSLNRWGRLVRWLQGLVKRLPEPARPLNRLTLVKDEFLGCMADIQLAQAGLLHERITRARSLRELWHLRLPLYGVVCQCFSQTEAERRLGRLNRHFPTRTARQTTLPGQHA